MYVCMYACMYACMHEQIDKVNRSVHIHTYIYIFLFMVMYVYILVHFPTDASQETSHSTQQGDRRNVNP